MIVLLFYYEAWLEGDVLIDVVFVGAMLVAVSFRFLRR